jgi:hypothetical protein
MSRYRFVAAEKLAPQAVTRACAVLGVSRSTYYHQDSQPATPRKCQDAALRERIACIHQESRGTYGVPQVHGVLQREGVRCGKKRVACCGAGWAHRPLQTTQQADDRGR